HACEVSYRVRTEKVALPDRVRIHPRHWAGRRHRSPSPMSRMPKPSVVPPLPPVAEGRDSAFTVLELGCCTSDYRTFVLTCQRKQGVFLSYLSNDGGFCSHDRSALRGCRRPRGTRRAALRPRPSAGDPLAGTCRFSPSGSSAR